MLSTYPRPDLALVPADKSLGVLLNNLGERRPVPDVVDPPRELRVPNAGVATDRLVVLYRPVDEIVGLRKRPLAPCSSLRTAPFHAVLGRDLAKILLYSRRGAALEAALVGAGAVVQLSFLLVELID